MKANIVLLPGDGIGPEVVGEAVRVLDVIAGKFKHEWVYQERLMGGCSIDRYGSSLTDETLADCQAADAVLLGAVGGPKWDDPNAKDRPERGLLALRKGLGVFANLRPVKVHPALIDSSPLKPEKLEGVDILVIRELTGGLYFGWPKGRDVKDGRERAVDTLEYYDYEIRRVMELAFKLAKGRKRKVTSVDKANVLESSRLWRQIAVRGRDGESRCGSGACLGRYRRHAPDHGTGLDRCDGHRKHVRRHSHRRSFGAGGLDGNAALGQSGGGPGRAVRADSRLGPRHRREGYRQPDRHDPVHRHAVAPLAGAGDGSRRRRTGGGRHHHRRGRAPPTSAGN